MRYPNLNSILFAPWRRIVSFVLAILLFTTSAPFPAFSVENGEQGSGSVSTPSSGELIYDYDTLHITRDGEDITALDLLHHEKIELSADGLTEEATYQWQVQHPEKDDVWVNVYDGTKQTISVTMALVENVLRENGTAKLRCRAYTDTYAYLTNPVTVKVRSEETAVTPARYAMARSNDGIMLAADDPAPEFVTITIEYVQYDFKRDAYGNLVIEDGELVYDEGKQAFTSYMATIHGGTDLNTTVHFPTMVGYDSYIVIDGVQQKATSYAINLTEVKSDIVYTVKYLPAEVDYVVRYFFQNIYDDLYVENTSLKVNERGFTGSVPPDSIMDKHIAGFTSLYYQPDAIAADGSTVFEVFYERNYYLMEFDCDGGYGAETVYVRYGSYISVPQPVKTGYIFGKDGDGNGWDLVKTEDPSNTEELGTPILDAQGKPTGFYTGDGLYNVLPTTMPAYNSAYKAVWKTADTTYTVVYWVESKDGTKSYVGSRVVEAESADVVDGTDDLNTSTNLCGKVEHEHDGSCGLSCGKTEHTTHNTTAGECCSIEEHTHSVALGCYENCNHTTHNELSCYTTRTDIQLANDQNGNAKTAFDRLTNNLLSGDHPIEGYVYRCKRSTNNNTNYNFFYINNTWYYLGYGDTYKGISVGDISNPDRWNFVYGEATVTCSHEHGVECSSCTIGEHTHGVGCNALDCPYGGLHTHGVDCKYTCGLDAHIHSDACKVADAAFMEFDRADGNVVVDGDGSTVVNVYYKYRTYTIRFIYARQNGSYFEIATLTGCGQYNNNHSANVDHNGTGYGQGHVNVTWSRANGLPAITDSYYTAAGRNGKFTEGNITYYYIALTAEYGADIESIWPDASIGAIGSYEFGSWGAECASPYRNYNSEHANIVGPYPIMSSEMIVANPTKLADGSYLAQTMVAWWGGSGDNVSEHAYHIFYEVSADESYDTVKDGKYYKLDRTLEFTAAHNGTTRVDPFMYNGYTIIDSQKSGYANSQANLYNCDEHQYCHAFYYNGNVWNLSLYNYNVTLSGVGGELSFGTLVKEFLGIDYVNLTNQSYVQTNLYPQGIEPNAYTFGGWYTTPEWYDGTEVEWDNLTMPDGDLTIYAKWTPVLRNVKFYSAYSDIPSDSNLTGNTPFMTAEDVTHGSTLGSTYLQTPEWPEDLDQAINNGAQAELYDFVGWFYMDEDNKKKFAPDSMEITRDLILFAEWQTSIDTTYEVQYILEKDASEENTQDGNAYSAGSEVAETITAHSSVGKTKTFAAKGLGELYPAFRKKFFPTVNSHSILMEPDSSLNKFTFKYVYDDTVYYKVRYVDYATRTELAESKIATTDEAIITEKFLPIKGYIPQSYYIRKTLAADGVATEPIDENIITFYYVKDTEHGLYSIEYYLENADSTDSSKPENYYQYESIVGSDDLIVGGKKNVITAEIRTYEGFTYVPDMNTVITYKTDGTANTPLTGAAAGDPPKGELDYTGLTIKVYYKRNEYPYIIEYREYGAAADAPALEVIKKDKAKYDSELSHTAKKSFTGTDGLLYEYYIENPTNEQLTKSTTIRQSDTGEENKLVFYYKKHEVTVIYTPVCTVPDVDDFGIVSLYSERAATAAGLSGSTATAGSGFVFKGWYQDEACTIPVESGWVTDGTTLKPAKLDTAANEVRYYALFEPVLSSMTIQKEVQNLPGDMSNDDNFLFHVKGVGKTAYIDIIVSISGNGSVTLKDLPIGDYIVTELTNWSWEYEASPTWSYTGDVQGSTAAASITVSTDGGTITFTNTYVEQDWLGGEGSNENKFN